MYANRIDRYVRASIAERGGTGRRLAEIALHVTDGPIGDRSDEMCFSQSVRFLVATGRYFLDEPGFGFVYLCPRT